MMYRYVILEFLTFESCVGFRMSEAPVRRGELFSPDLRQNRLCVIQSLALSGLGANRVLMCSDSVLWQGAPVAALQ